jgi:DNA-directed RNA polymerase subunit E"
MKELRACKSCALLSEEQVCPKCGGQTSKEWQGYIAILDASKSEIAKRMRITQNGKYALRVR